MRLRSFTAWGKDLPRSLVVHWQTVRIFWLQHLLTAFAFQPKSPNVFWFQPPQFKYFFIMPLHWPLPEMYVFMLSVHVSHYCKLDISRMPGGISSNLASCPVGLKDEMIMCCWSKVTHKTCFFSHSSRIHKQTLTNCNTHVWQNKKIKWWNFLPKRSVVNFTVTSQCSVKTSLWTLLNTITKKIVSYISHLVR